MGFESNRWNRLRYSFWAPVYDLLARRFVPVRRDSIALLDLSPGARLLVVGAGTGADLPLLPPRTRVLATDLTPAMLKRARARLEPGMHLAVMDGHSLAVPDGTFDAALLHLVLAVIADPARCLGEAARAVRPGGLLVVLDKFVRGRGTPLLLRIVNPVIRLLFTDMTRRFEGILESSGAPLVLVEDRPAMFGGLYRHVLLRRMDGGHEPRAGQGRRAAVRSGTPR